MVGVFKCGVVLRTDMVAQRVQGTIQVSPHRALKLKVNCLYRPRRLCMKDILVLKGSGGRERSFPPALSLVLILLLLSISTPTRPH